MTRAMKHVAATIIAVINATSSASAQADTNWRALYLGDLDAARARIAANHPGMLDRLNPSFAPTLDSAYEEARRAASIVTNYASFAMALRRFSNRFQDAHLSVAGTRPVPIKQEAGIYAAHRNGRFVVALADGRYGADSVNLLNAVISSCDGRTADSLFSERVLPWYGRRSVPGDRITYALQLFFDYGAPQPEPPARCSFIVNGVERTIALQWKTPDTSALRARIAQLSQFPDRNFGVSLREKDRLLWVTVPTFSTRNEQQITAMRNTIDSLRKWRAFAGKSYDAIVFDVRGNEGGSSSWGDQLIAAVADSNWLQAAVRWLFDGVYVEWRVSPDNIDAVRGLVKQLTANHGAESPQVRSMQSLVSGLEKAHAKGEAYFGNEQKRRGVKPPPPSRVPPVFVLTSSHCFSACLDFLDRAKLLPGMRHIGEPTGADTDYMENWGARLPSGLAQIGHPMKVYRNRRRAHNQPYTPDAIFPGSIRDTEAIVTWIGTLLPR